MAKVLIIDDDPAFCLMLKTFLTKNGFDAERVLSARESLKALKEGAFDIVLTDFRLPEKDGIELLKEIKQINPYIPVILMTGYGDIKTAVKAMKLGAYEYVTKPINPDEILITIRGALGDQSSQNGQNERPEQSFQYITGNSYLAQKLNEHIELVAPTNMSVIIKGESGTGKEYVARRIHDYSNRSEQTFVALDCGALSNELAASELFGHLKGSFTGAINNKQGQFEAANGGTLFLDEIGNLSYEIQMKLLRAIQERKIKKIGGNKDIEVDVRIIAASNEDLKEAVREGQFREDLYHRLNEFSLEVPALRERDQDIDYFVEHFLELSNNELGKDVKGFDELVLEKFHQYQWPGNIRELKNIVKRAVLLAQSELIDMGCLPPEIMHPDNHTSKVFSKPSNPTDLKAITEKQEKEIIVTTLEKTRYNKSKAAKMLNIDRKTLYNKMRLYKLEG
ncbi:MAG: sigma-54-dependent transcriptional regulator [Cyclobacteriaceae bacterium]